ncbi:KGGVGR-motif variant AAA ATPase [Pseudomonas syringae]|uniref:KGGVGR-motif variant AAA ATPase n=1 Tax=Pseudomonas syringae TaxID=317 RepID=UPI000515DBA2|nr:hypothetical protein [Pseudomonas syringae]
MSANKVHARYDDVLPILVGLVVSELGKAFFEQNLVYRDADGIVTIVMREEVPQDQIEKISERAKLLLKGYASSPLFVTPDDLFDITLNDKSQDDFELVQISDGSQIYVRYIEKRIVGNDWVRGIQSEVPGTPQTVVFASLKGGVGRSTALSIAAMELCKLGKSILAIDLDLEAPGIGGMLLKADKLPIYGALDYYVEYGRSTLDSEFLNGMCVSYNPYENSGQITVVPATGKSSLENPANVLGKISRAYLESVDEQGATKTFLDKTRDMLSALSKNNTYDAIFIDARAGLNESTAATIQGLGADILFFGIDTPQTWEGYKYFFSHMAKFKTRASLEQDWRYKIKIVHAKALGHTQALKAFRDESFELFATYLYDEAEENELADGLPNSFSFDLDDNAAPHYAWPIFMSENFFEFKPQIESRHSDIAVIEPVFGEFLENLKERLQVL